MRLVHADFTKAAGPANCPARRVFGKYTRDQFPESALARGVDERRQELPPEPPATRAAFEACGLKIKERTAA